MRDHGFYGYSVLQYEKDHEGNFRDPNDIPAQVLSCFATHDTPTVKGYEIGRDIDWWQKLDWIDETSAEHMRHERSTQVAAFSHGTNFQTSIHALLARSNAELVAVQLDDILGVAEAQNLPGTIEQHPNWRRKYDVSLSELPDHAQLIKAASLMRASNRTHNQRTEP
jgi:4-alpha-glucanotransferase